MAGYSQGRRFYGGIGLPLKKGSLIFQSEMWPPKSAPPKNRISAEQAEIGDFVEYDLHNEDEDWLQDFDRERLILPAEKFQIILFKLEVLDHKARERAGVITPTLGSIIHVLLTFDAAVEALHALSIQYGGNLKWMQSRENSLKSPVWRGHENEIRPFGNPRACDSANLDSAAEVLRLLFIVILNYLPSAIIEAALLHHKKLGLIHF
ncbi:hypothetical protein L2E82_04997 [Cichorium intybus]|uniref:Uncharacterized protein n=1 Tax=Cichorium intybus TaxID=13427 RepID=A0ACB9H7P7_CICIN|nr:hypothetical protein L2E82_04997 [Cichorium intybus]